MIFSTAFFRASKWYGWELSGVMTQWSTNVLLFPTVSGSKESSCWNNTHTPMKQRKYTEWSKRILNTSALGSEKEQGGLKVKNWPSKNGGNYQIVLWGCSELQTSLIKCTSDIPSQPDAPRLVQASEPHSSKCSPQASSLSISLPHIWKAESKPLSPLLPKTYSVWIFTISQGDL